jgi:hypothetical protein
MGEEITWIIKQKKKAEKNVCGILREMPPNNAAEFAMIVIIHNCRIP